MADSIGEPGKQVEDGILVRREDIAEIGAIEDVFEGGKYFDPDGWPVFARNESRLDQLEAVCWKPWRRTVQSKTISGTPRWA